MIEVDCAWGSLLKCIMSIGGGVFSDLKMWHVNPWFMPIKYLVTWLKQAMNAFQRTDRCQKEVIQMST